MYGVWQAEALCIASFLTFDARTGLHRWSFNGMIRMFLLQRRVRDHCSLSGDRKNNCDHALKQVPEKPQLFISCSSLKAAAVRMYTELNAEAITRCMYMFRCRDAVLARAKHSWILKFTITHNGFAIISCPLLRLNDVSSLARGLPGLY
jgi:hypothetical protein